MLKENPVFLLNVAKAKLEKLDRPVGPCIHPNSKAYDSGYWRGRYNGIALCIKALEELIMENEEN